MRQQRWPAMIVLLTMLLVSCRPAPPKKATVEPDNPVPVAVDESGDLPAAGVEAEAPSVTEPLTGDDRDAPKETDLKETDGASVETIAGLAGGERLLPVDEAEDDASFVAFRTQLMDAIDNKDTEFLLAIVSPDIQIGFGRAMGIEDFKQQWQLTEPDSQIWAQLEAVLALGGEFQTDFADPEAAHPTFIAPYLFNTFPGKDYSPFEYAVVVADEVILRAEPDVRSTAIAALSYHIVKIDRAGSVEVEPGSYNYTWYKVTTTDGDAGYVAGQYVRSPIDYRAFFEKEADQWMLTTFLAGD